MDHVKSVAVVIHQPSNCHLLPPTTSTDTPPSGTLPFPQLTITLPLPQLSHSHSLNCHTPIPSTVTLPFPQLSHSHSLNCHTPIPSTVTLPFPQLSHSHSLNCHTPIPSTVTLPFPQLSHSHSLNCHTPIPSTVTLPFPQLSHSPHHHTLTHITVPDGVIIRSSNDDSVIILQAPHRPSVTPQHCGAAQRLAVPDL